MGVKATLVLLGLPSNKIILTKAMVCALTEQEQLFSPFFLWRGTKQLALECPVLPSCS